MLRFSKFTKISKKFKLIENFSTKIDNYEKMPEHLTNNYQYLQNSILPTLYFQKSLPRLPIPNLNKTCERYLLSLTPLLTNDQLNATKTLLNNFELNIGNELQQLLIEYDKNNLNTSYISQQWFNMYLMDRKPLPINYNPVILMKNHNNPNYNNQLIRSANIIVSSLRFMKSLYNNNLKPEIYHINDKKTDNNNLYKFLKLSPTLIATYIAYAFKAYPLDMSQYNNLFSTTRIPGYNLDKIYRSNDLIKHIIVMKNGNIYSVDVLDDDGNIESPNVILGRLKYIQQDNQIANAQHPIGCLTTENRNIWSELREHLCSLSKNNNNLMKIIDSSLFCLCLDNINNYNNNDNQLNDNIIKNYLSNDGKNRWFDKSLSVIVDKNGLTGINFEHSWGDGVAVLRYFNEIYNEITNSPYVQSNTIGYLKNKENNNSIKLLQFQLDDKIINGIANAQIKHNKILNKLNIRTIENFQLNKNVCKLNNLSPDSIMQLSFQLAYKKLNHNNYVSTYESCSTSAFRHGRTETIRPCTIETKKFCDTILSSSSSSVDNSNLINLMLNCSNYHQKLTKDAAMGQGFDRHLFGLKFMAELNNYKLPDIFNHYSYELINNNILSTSTLSSNGITAGAFGPVLQDGLGIGYSIQNDKCGAVVSFYDDGNQNGNNFVESLNETFNQIHQILTNK